MRQDLYAVAVDDDGDAWIEFYWAEDRDHAREQALDANPGCKTLAAGFCPYARQAP